MASLNTRASSYVLNHLCLLHNGLLGDVCGSDLLRDSSRLAILNVSVSQLHTPKEKNSKRVDSKPSESKVDIPQKQSANL